MGEKKELKRKTSIFDDDALNELEELEELEAKPKNDSKKEVKKEEKTTKKEEEDKKEEKEHKKTAEDKKEEKEHKKTVDDKKEEKEHKKIVDEKKEVHKEEQEVKKVMFSRLVDDDKKSNKKKKTVKKTKKKEKMDDILADDEKSSLGVQIIVALIITAIIILLLLKSCDKGKKEYSVTFNTNGGTVIADLVVEEDFTVSKPTAPVKEGYEFVGWYYNDKLYDFSTPVTGNITLEARWAEVAKVDGVSLDQTSIQLSPGGETTIVATVTPENAKDKSLVWISSDPEIATVDANGKVKALKEGKATITATTKFGGFTASSIVTVNSNVIAATGVTLNKTNLTLAPNESSTITATVKPTNASNKGVTWSSSNENVAIVSSKGKVTAKQDGTATITVATKDGNFTATCNVTVKTVKVTGIRVSNETVTIKEKQSTTVTATVSPTNATNKGVTWKSDDTSIATVSSSGKITGIKAGTTTVTVTTKDGNFSKTIIVTVKAPVVAESLTISGDSTDIEGAKINLKANVLPDEADNKTVTWTSSDTSIATVSSKGVVTLKKAGTVTITAETVNGIKATHKITVKEKPKTYSYSAQKYKADDNAVEYVRIKVFNEKGVDVTANVTVFDGNSRISKQEGYIQLTKTAGEKYLSGNSIKVIVGGTEYNATKK